MFRPRAGLAEAGWWNTHRSYDETVGEDPDRRGVSRRWMISEVENSLRSLAPTGSTSTSLLAGGLLSGSCGADSSPAIATTLPRLHERNHAASATAPGVEHVPTIECAHDSFRHPTALASRYRSGDDGLVSVSTGGPLLCHERAGQPLGRPDDRYRVKGGVTTNLGGRSTSRAFAELGY